MPGGKKKRKLSSLKQNVIKEPLTADQSEKTVNERAHRN